MATNHFEHHTKAAIYCRLSKEDRYKLSDDDDSRSIMTQKIMLQDYASRNGLEVYDIYNDEDYSGSDDTRPEFNRMLEDARHKKFEIVICKDQSRFARDMIVVEKYINRLFPVWGIRFIGVSDGTDTAEINNKKSRQIKSLVDEWYLEDTSDRIKSALHARMKDGLFIGSFAPYGYARHPNNINRLIVDEEAADIVRLIFRLFVCENMGKTNIARYLNNAGIPNPSAYKESKGIKKNMSSRSNNSIWRYGTVSNILSNEVYIGNLVQHKYKNPTYHAKHSIPCSKNEYIKVEGTHEPIIDLDLWNISQKMLKQREKPFSAICDGDPAMHPKNLFSSKLCCLYCGYHLTTGINTKNGKKTRYYRCAVKLFDKTKCPDGVTVFDKTIEKYVLSAIKKLTEEYFDVKNVSDRVMLQDDTQQKIKRIEFQKSDLKKKIENFDKCLADLYLDKATNTITQEQFTTISNRFICERTDAEEKCKELDLMLQEIREKQTSRKEIVDIVKEYASCTELTKPMVDTFIDKIYIGGTKNNRIIKIHWNF